MHTLGVEERLIPGLLADVHVYPSLPVDRIDFSPDMVLGIPDPSDS